MWALKRKTDLFSPKRSNLLLTFNETVEVVSYKRRKPRRKNALSDISEKPLRPIIRIASPSSTCNSFSKNTEKGYST